MRLLPMNHMRAMRTLTCLARRLTMSGVAGGYTLVLADEAHDGAPVTDYIVTDGGVLFATADHGATWRCYGLVDPGLFLLDLGFMEALELAETDATPAPHHRVPAC
jgi:hypothetical protein